MTIDLTHPLLPFFKYPFAKEAPHHLVAQGKTLHVIKIDGNLLCLDEQIAGPWEDHLIGRGTVTWKAHLMSGDQTKNGKVFCVKASWAQMEGETRRTLRKNAK